MTLPIDWKYHSFLVFELRLFWKLCWIPPGSIDWCPLRGKPKIRYNQNIIHRWISITWGISLDLCIMNHTMIMLLTIHVSLWSCTDGIFPVPSSSCLGKCLMLLGSRRRCCTLVQILAAFCKPLNYKWGDLIRIYLVCITSHELLV